MSEKFIELLEKEKVKTNTKDQLKLQLSTILRQEISHSSKKVKKQKVKKVVVDKKTVEQNKKAVEQAELEKKKEEAAAASLAEEEKKIEEAAVAPKAEEENKIEEAVAAKNDAKVELKIDGQAAKDMELGSAELKESQPGEALVNGKKKEVVD